MEQEVNNYIIVQVLSRNEAGWKPFQVAGWRGAVNWLQCPKPHVCLPTPKLLPVQPPNPLFADSKPGGWLLGQQKTTSFSSTATPSHWSDGEAGSSRPTGTDLWRSATGCFPWMSHGQTFLLAAKWSTLPLCCNREAGFFLSQINPFPLIWCCSLFLFEVVLQHKSTPSPLVRWGCTTRGQYPPVQDQNQTSFSPGPGCYCLFEPLAGESRNDI